MYFHGVFRTVKVWGLGAPTPHFSLEGHERGVNSIDYYPGGDRPYLLSGKNILPLYGITCSFGTLKAKLGPGWPLFQALGKTIFHAASEVMLRSLPSNFSIILLIFNHFCLPFVCFLDGGQNISGLTLSEPDFKFYIEFSM